MSVSVLNTDAGLSGKTLVNLEDSQTVTGAKLFDRDPNPPFSVSSGSAVVPNLDADKVDGVDISTLAANRIPYASGAATLTNSSGFTFDGTTLTIPGQVAFPAAQSASSGVNTLDDYEEGTWQPTLTSSGGGTPTYTTQTASYIKIGKTVWVGGRLTLATKGTLAAGTIKLASLPFTTATGIISGININYFGNITGASNIVHLDMFVDAAATTVNIYQATNGAGQTAMAATTLADVNTTFDIIFSGCYQASA